MDVGFWIMNVLFLGPWLYVLFWCFKIIWDDSFQESKRGNGPSSASYTPQAGDGVAGAGHRGNGGSGFAGGYFRYRMTADGPPVLEFSPFQQCQCEEHFLELYCDHGRMRFIKCYVCGSDWLIPAVKPNTLKELKIKPIPTKVVRW